MNKKQFIVVDHSTCVFDKITKEEYVCIDREEAFLVCKRLNNQQDTIDKQKEAIDCLKTYNLQHFLEWLVIKGYVADESMKDINNVIDCVGKFKKYLTVSASMTEL